MFEELSTDRQRQVIEICREFEEARCGNEPVPLLEFLKQVPIELRDDVLMELIAIDVEMRLAGGAEISAADYAMQFPELADLIESTIQEVRTQWNSSVAARTEQRLGDFLIVRELGRGGMGVVYEAVQESLQRHVALKVLPKHTQLAGSAEQRFEREAKAIARLHHHRIVEVHATGEHEGVRYFAMRLIDGCGLNQLIEDWRSESALKPSGTAPMSEISRRFQTALAEPKDAPTVIVPRTDAANDNSLAPVLRGEGRGEGPSKTSQEPLTPNPSPRSTGARGEQTSQSIEARSRFAAEIGLQVAEALHYAHGEGVLHRDVKPSNIMLDQRGQAWLTDFGLAKLMQADAGQTLTEQGDVVGTLRYMAPETLHGQTDARSDVYGLGMTLLEMLALKHPLEGVGRDELLQQLLQAESPSVRSLLPGLPLDLVTILQTAIERDPASRYQSAGELADDLRRFLADEPIRARPISALERFARWARRNKLIASLLLSVFLLLSVGLVGSVIAAVHFKTLEGEQRSLVTEKSRLVDEKSLLANEKSKLADEKSKLAEQNGQLAKDAQAERDRSTLLVADVLAKQGLDAADSGKELEAAVLFAGAGEKSYTLDPQRYRANVTRFQALSRQMATLEKTLTWPDVAIPLSFTFHPQGTAVVTRARLSQRSVVADLSTGNEIALPMPAEQIGALAWSADGARLLVGGTGKVTSLRFPQLDDSVVIDEVSSPPVRVQVLAADPTGRWIAIGCGSTLRMWDVQQREFLGSPISLAQPITELLFSSDGEWLVSVTDGNQFQAFATAKLSRTESPSAPTFVGAHIMDRRGARARPVFLRGNSALLTYSAPGQVELRELASPDRPQQIRHDAWLLTTLELIDDTTVFVGGVKGGGFLRVLPGAPPTVETAKDFSGEVYSASYNSARRELFVGYSNRPTERWLLPELRRLPCWFTSSSGCFTVQDSPDENRLLTAGGNDRLSHLWRLSPQVPNPVAQHLHPSAVQRAEFSADSRYVAMSDAPGAVVIQDLHTREIVGRVKPDTPSPSPQMVFPSLLPDNERLLTYIWLSPQQRELRVWNWRTGALLQTIPVPAEWEIPHDMPMHFTANRKQLLLPLGKRRTALWLDLTATPLTSQELSFEQVTLCAGISPNGRWIAGSRSDRSVMLMPHRLSPDVQSIGPLLGIDSRTDLQFSQDVGRIAISTREGTVLVWDLPTANSDPLSSSSIKPPARLQHPDGLHYSEFSSDNRYLLTVGRDASVRVWDIVSQRVVGTPITSVNDMGGRFRPGHAELVTVDYDGRFDVWDWRSSVKLWTTQRLFKQPARLWDTGRTLTLSPDGRFAAVGGFGEVFVIDLSPLDVNELPSSDELRRQAEVLSGLRLLDNGGVTKLTQQEWQQRLGLK